ncbi:MAG: FAD-binding oxidoreductase [Actinobacteria bacterium]|nr:FAD-binding oxidoreductase [Actinomycetota bacterium]
MTKKFDAVVIGSGALGSSTAFHLMREGQDVVLLDRGQAASETSPRAAGLGLQLQADDIISAIARLGIEKLVAFEEETGVPLACHQSGSIKVARSEADEAQIHGELERARNLGLELDTVTPKEARELAPWFDPSSAREMWYAPGDTYLEPGDVARAYVAAFRAGGGTVREHAEVVGIGSGADGGVTHVELADGSRIEAGSVVIAAGPWSPVVAALADVELPLWAVRHELIITTAIDGVDNTQPAVRIMDAKVYARPCNGGLMFGGYEPDPLTMDLRQTDPGFSTAVMPLDGEPMRRLVDEVSTEFAPLTRAEWRELRGGLTTLVPDGHFLVGPLEQMDGLWVISGCNVGGLSTSPALGGHLARWVARGERHPDLEPFDPNRFGDRYHDQELLRRAALATYVDKYSDDEVLIRGT